MTLQTLFHRLADDAAPRSLSDRALQAALGAVGTAYGAGAYANRRLYELCLRRRHSLPFPVLCVGNVSLGGTGKTPMTIWLARRLKELGRSPAVLSRGYRRRDERALTLVHDGQRLLATVEQAGDEPVLIARALGNVPVAACADRARGGRAIARRFPETDVLILDDGFQHHRLERDGDFVLLDVTQPWRRLRLFPRGTLREPLAVLDRAHLFVLTRCDDEAAATRMAGTLQRRYPTIPVARTRLAPTGLQHLATKQTEELTLLKGAVVLVVCGVGRPEAVARTVRSLGARVVGLEALADHAALSPADVTRFEALRRSLGAQYVVVTEKDAVKLAEHPDPPPEGWLALKVELQFLSEADQLHAERAVRNRLRMHKQSSL